MIIPFHILVWTTWWITVQFLPNPRGNLLSWPPETGGELGFRGDDIRPMRPRPQPWDLRASTALLCAPWVVPGESDFCLLIPGRGSLGMGGDLGSSQSVFLANEEFSHARNGMGPGIPARESPCLGSWPGALLAPCVQLLLSRVEKYTRSAGCLDTPGGTRLTPQPGVPTAIVTWGSGAWYSGREPVPGADSQPLPWSSGQSSAVQVAQSSEHSGRPWLSPASNRHGHPSPWTATCFKCDRVPRCSR